MKWVGYVGIDERILLPVTTFYKLKDSAHEIGVIRSAPDRNEN